MSDSVPFRSASTPLVSTSDTGEVTVPDASNQQAKADNTDAPPSLYSQLEGQPYAVKVLGLDLYYGDSDFGEVREQAQALDEYVVEKIKARGMKDEESSYSEVLEAIYKQIGKSKNEDPTQTLKRLSTAAGALRRLSKAKLPEVLDAKSMEPEEFEAVSA